MRWKRKRKFFQSRRFRSGVAFLILLTLTVVLVAPRAKRRLVRWSVDWHVNRAEAAYARADYRHALLDARIALESNPLKPEALRVIARSLEAMNRREAIIWRRHLDALGYGDTENTIAWASDAVKAGDPATARSILASLAEPERKCAAFHSVAAEVALAMRDETSADTHWREAARLDPGEDKYPMSLAKMRLGSLVPGVRTAALAALAGLSEKPGHSVEALRTLLDDALNHADAGRSADIADRLVAAPGAIFADSLTRLATLRALKDPEAGPFLLKLKDEAISKPRELFQLLAWMNRSGLARTVSDWIPGLPENAASEPPVALAIAETHALCAEWEKLGNAVAGASWKQDEYLRSAYLALAADRLRDPNPAAAAWNTSFTEAKASVEAMETLARFALAWGWEEKAMTVLWRLSDSALCPRWGLDLLWSVALRRGETDSLYRLSRVLARANPKDIANRHNVVLLGLLTRGEGGTIHGMAETLYKESPGNPDVTATYGLSLYLRGHVDAALALMEKLEPAQLRKPGVARYYGIFLSAAEQTAKAREYLELGTKGVLLPEELALINNPRLPPSIESEMFLRRLNKTAASVR